MSETLAGIDLRKHRLEMIIALVLLERINRGEPPIAYSKLASSLGYSAGSFTPVIRRMLELGVIETVEPVPRGQLIRLTTEGVRRTRWSRQLGARALVGLDHLRLAVLTALDAISPRAVLSTYEVGTQPGCANVTWTVLNELRNASLIIDARDVYAPGVGPNAWHITDFGRLLLRCLGGEPAPVFPTP